MKRIIAVLLAFLFYLPISSYSQVAKKDSSLKNRNYQQQLYVMAYIKEQEPQKGFNSPDQVLSFMEQMEHKWAQQNADQSEIYKSFNTYAPMWATYRVFKSDLPKGSKCLIYSEIALPAFVKDVTFLKEQLKNEANNLEEAAYLIRTPNLVWAATESLPYTCNLEKEQWDNLKEAIINYPDLIEKYLNADALPEAETERYRKLYQKVLNISKKAVEFVELQDKIYQQDFSSLFTKLTTEFPNSGDYRYLYVEIAKNLWEKYYKRNETDLAFATLDLLARNTSEESLSRNKLRSMYTETDPRQGPARFESINSSSSSSLTLSQEKQRLAGKYFDAQKGKYVQLNIPSDKIVLLDFWSVSCGPCIDEIPTLNELAKKYDDKIKLISINNDLLYGSNKKDLEEFVTEHNIQYPVIMDTEQKNLMQQFGVGGWPARFLLNEEGYFFKEPVENRIKLSMSEIENFLKKN